MLKAQMEKIYRTIPLDQIPWNMKSPPKILTDFVQTKKVKPCKSIELGCGAGNYEQYLSRMGFTASGVDFSETAIEIAKKSAEEKGLDCRFIQADVLGDLAEIQDTFDFVYDWELLHHIFPESRPPYLNNVARLLKPEGLYWSVFFSEDSTQFGGIGKYRKTPIDTELYFSCESEMRLLYDVLFDIQELKTIEIQGKFGPHKAIHALLNKNRMGWR
jgi:SAM-dependent methyltransferase